MDDGGASPEVLRMFEQAAKVVRERTLRDAARADNEDARRILEAIADGLFRPDFKVSALKPSRAARAWFAEHKNTTPDGYRGVRRVEVTMFVLDYTDAEVPTIARLVGYSSARSLSSAFKRIQGYPPSEERRRWRAGLVEGQPPGSGKPEVPRVMEAKERHRRDVAPRLRKAAAGGLSIREASALLARLRFGFPNPGTPRPVGKPAVYGYVYRGDPAVDFDRAPSSPSRNGRRPSLSYAEERIHVETALRSTLEVLARFDPEMPRRLQGILDELRDNLLRPDYDLEILKRELIVDNMDLAGFARRLGTPAGKYAFEARMEMTAQLLSGSPLAIRAIACHVDYAGPKELRRAFKQWSGGLAPADFRHRMRAAAERAGPIPPEYLHWRYLEGLEQAAPEERLAWLRYMEKLYLLEPRTGELPPEAASR